MIFSIKKLSIGVSNLFNINQVKADFKQIFRDPILILFMFLPLLIFIIFKLLIVFLVPFISFEISNYLMYILAFSFIMSPQMLGTVAGFLMIDDRDAKIYELMSITPLGYSGYIIHRLSIPMVFAVFYTILGYYILNIYPLNKSSLFLIAILMGIEGIITSLILFNLADDKVKGLTISKAMGIFPLMALADLLNIKWISYLSHLFPFYWITKIIQSPSNLTNLFTATLIHFLWLFFINRIKK